MHMLERSWVRMACCLGLLLGCGGPVLAQLLAGPWLVVSEKKIDAARKTDLRVIVLDAAGHPVSGASVRIEQTRRAFHVGLVLPETGWPEQGLGAGTHTEFWRCFNAISLERLTDWPGLQPDPGSELDPGRLSLIEKVLDKAGPRGPPPQRPLADNSSLPG